MADQSLYAADAAAFGANMNNIAHSQTMLAAIRDYQKVRSSFKRVMNSAVVALPVSCACACKRARPPQQPQWTTPHILCASLTGAIGQGGGQCQGGPPGDSAGRQRAV